MTFIAGAPGEAPPESHKDVDEPTGTDVDAIPTGDETDLPDDPMARALAEVFERQAAGETDEEQGDDQEPESPQESDTVEEAGDQQGEEEEPEATPSPAPPPASYTLPDGRVLTADEALAALNVYEWSQQLSNEQLQTIDAVLSGRAQLAPTQPPVDVREDEEEYIDTRLASEFQQLREQVSRLVEYQQTEAQRAATSRRTELQSAVDTAVTSITTKYGLTEDEVQQLQTRTASLQIVPGIAAKYPSNPSAAFEEAMEVAYWSDPAFRDREMQRQMDVRATQQDELKQRRQKAGSVAGSGGSVSRTPAPVTLNKEQRDKAMADEIRAASGEQA